MALFGLSEEERIIDDDTLKNKRKCILMIHPPVVIGGEVSVFDTFQHFAFLFLLPSKPSSK